MAYRGQARGQRRREKLLEIHGGKCFACDIGDPELLQFHHVDPRAKSFRMTSDELRNHTWVACLEESLKCIVSCPTHHAVDHQRINRINTAIEEAKKTKSKI